ncbi:hypothetical protein H6G45_03355 [Synechocystis sp. FACHB-383]|uniref:hypothetical protein n=1 Tax=Synechocystis sp. FACHB-383 TaxID=2692864 RepID=UPI001684B033|nr:hypothetical protein [Synechocystis sp. FACHB-383]MBD2652550.1 hypothetical protein [Synechocystis sp. FACHB-383]
MALSPLSRFQACLLLALGGKDQKQCQPSLDSLPPWEEPWGNLLASPYQTCLPQTFWQNALSRQPTFTPPQLINWLIVLALYHHENPLGFRQDLSHWCHLCQNHCPEWVGGAQAQPALLLWQRLLTLILSERFTVPQLPVLLKQPEKWWPIGPAPTFSPMLLNHLTAIAEYLQNHAPRRTMGQSPDPWVDVVGTAIYLWGKNPTQPRLIIRQLQSVDQPPPKAIVDSLPNENQANDPDLNPDPGILPPLTLALVGAYNGMEISQQALTTDHRSAVRANFLPLGQRLWQRWSGQLCIGSGQEHLPLAVAPPLGMQRRSSLKLVSQQEYGQILPTHGN